MSENVSRRKFLKLASATTLGLGAAYAVPRITTIRAAESYSGLTKVEVCEDPVVSTFYCRFSNGSTTVWFKVVNNCDRRIRRITFEQLSGHSVDMNHYQAQSYTGRVIGEVWRTDFDSSFPGVKFSSIYDHGNFDGEFEMFEVIYEGNALHQQVKYKIEAVNGEVFEGTI